MTSLENYARIIEQVFGPDILTFNRHATTSNNVIGALNSLSNFNTFSINFTERLQRLKKLYESEPDSYKALLDMVNEIASPKNWEGAYAELCVYDHFNIDYRTGNAIFSEPTSINITLPSAGSLAQNLGQKDVNLDGFIPEYNIYFDVKCLKDNVGEILKGIYGDVCKHFKIQAGLDILAEYPLDSSYLAFQTNRRKLLDELKVNIDIQKRTRSITSRVIPGLCYRLQWGAGVNQAVRSYDPFQHARNLHSGIFNYTNKLLKNQPTILVLVTFPWYNLVISSFIDSNKYFYRSYARRVFCQYRHTNDLFSTLEPKYSGPESLYQVSQHLSAIIFLEDKSILGEADAITNVECYTYINPNAKNPISTSAKSYLLEISSALYDDFENDNY